MRKGDRICGLDCVVVRSDVVDVFGSKMGAQYWLKDLSDPDVRFVVKTRRLLHGSRVKLSGVVQTAERYSNGKTVVWVSNPRLYEQNLKEWAFGGVKVRF